MVVELFVTDVEKREEFDGTATRFISCVDPAIHYRIGWKEDAMGMMIARHRVRDYGQWRPIFDQHAEMQRAAGVSFRRQQQE